MATLAYTVCPHASPRLDACLTVLLPLVPGGGGTASRGAGGRGHSHSQQAGLTGLVWPPEVCPAQTLATPQPRSAEALGCPPSPSPPRGIVTITTNGRWPACCPPGLPGAHSSPRGEVAEPGPLPGPRERRGSGVTLSGRDVQPDAGVPPGLCRAPRARGPPGPTVPPSVVGPPWKEPTLSSVSLSRRQGGGRRRLPLLAAAHLLLQGERPSGVRAAPAVRVVNTGSCRRAPRVPLAGVATHDLWVLLRGPERTRRRGRGRSHGSLGRGPGAGTGRGVARTHSPAGTGRRG